jgi:hypothetical protein
VFNINYFKSGNVYAQENLKIDIEIIRKFFLEVIYQNAFIESDKNVRIDLIINIIFALSYILNHTVNSVPINDNEIINFAFIILGLGVFNNYGLSKYNQIKDLITEPTNNFINNTTDFMNKYLETFFQFALSYTYKDQEPIYKMYNDMTMSYVKNLAMFNANKLAYEIITDDKPNGNTYKVLQFINTWKFDITKNNILKNIITFMFYYKKIQALTGTGTGTDTCTGTDTNRGVLYAWIKRNKFNINQNDYNMMHPYALIDYLKDINYFNIIKNIIIIINNIDNFEIYKLKELENLKNEIQKYNDIQQYNHITDLQNINDSETPNFFKYEDMFNNMKTKLCEILTVLTTIKNKLLKIFFINIFDKDLKIYSLDYNNENHPLYYNNKMMRYLEDTLECIISNYNVDKIDKIDDVVNAFGNHLQLPIEIFKRELNNTLLPYFNISDSNNDFIKLIKTTLNNIYNETYSDSYVKKNPNLIPKYFWTENYKKKDLDNSKLVDKQIFTFINKLLNAKDEHNNYYLNSGNHEKLMEELGNIDNSDEVYKKFSNEILKGAYLFNNHEFNLNVKQVKDNLHKLNNDFMNADIYTYQDIEYGKIRQITKNQYYYYSKKINCNYLFLCIFNSINKFVNNLTGKFVINNDVRDLIINYQSDNEQEFPQVNITMKTNSNYDMKREIPHNFNKEIYIDYNHNMKNIQKCQAFILNLFFSKKIGTTELIYSNYNPIIIETLEENINTFIYEILLVFKSLNNIYPQLDTDRLNYNKLYKVIQNHIKDFNNKIKTQIDILNKIKIKYKYDVYELNGYNLSGDKKKIEFNVDGKKDDVDFNIENTYELKNNVYENFGNFEIVKIEDEKDIKVYYNEYFEYIYDFIDDLIEDVKRACRIVPINFDSEYINQNISHRNNLYLAVANMGFLNSKSTDYLSKNNLYFDIKINMLDKIYNKDKTLLIDSQIYKESFNYYKNLKTFLYGNNIFNEEQQNDIYLNTNIMNRYINKQNFIKFAKADELIYPKTPERCLYWTYPLFNINFGKHIQSNPPIPLTNEYNLNYQRSPSIYKILLFKFIKFQYSVIIDDNNKKLNMLGVLYRIEKNYLSENTQNLPKQYETLEITKSIKNTNTIVNVNENITKYYGRLIQILQQFNNANTTLKLPSSTVTLEYIIKLSKQLNNYISIGPLRKNIIQCLFEIFNAYLIYDSLNKYPSLAFSKFNLVKKQFENNDAILFNFIYIIFNLITFKKNVFEVNNGEISTIYNNIKDVKAGEIIYFSNYDELNNPLAYVVSTSQQNIFKELSYVNPKSITEILELYKNNIYKNIINNQNLVFLDYNNIVIDGFEQFIKEFKKIKNKPNTGLADYRQIMMKIINNKEPNNINNVLNFFKTKMKLLFEQNKSKMLLGGFRPSIRVNDKSILKKTTLNNYTKYYLTSRDKTKKNPNKKTKKQVFPTLTKLNKKYYNSLKQISISSRKTKRFSNQLMKRDKHNLSRNKYQM